MQPPIQGSFSQINSHRFPSAQPQTAGPHGCAATPVMTKMPAPTLAPTPGVPKKGVKLGMSLDCLENSGNHVFTIDIYPVNVPKTISNSAATRVKLTYPQTPYIHPRYREYRVQVSFQQCIIFIQVMSLTESKSNSVGCNMSLLALNLLTSISFPVLIKDIATKLDGLPCNYVYHHLSLYLSIYLSIYIYIMHTSRYNMYIYNHMYIYIYICIYLLN